MIIFKRIFKVGIIILGIVLFFKLLGILFFKSYKNEPIELIDFKPTESLEIQTSKPIYYYSDNKLYYSESGKLDLSKPIWKGKINERFYNNTVFVSNNSEFIALNDGNSIKVINTKGDLIKNISPISDHSLDNKNAFWESDFQWSKNSENLYLMKDNKDKESSLFKLSIKTRELKKIVDLKERVWHFYLSPNQNDLFYTAYDKINDNWLLKKLDLNTEKVIDTIQSNEKWKLITKDSIFINFKTSQIDFNNKRIGQSKNDTLCNIYLIDNKSEKLIFKVNCGFDAFKGRKLGCLENNLNIYLPDNRFFISHVYAKEKSGTIIIDTKTLEYKLYRNEIKPYFSNTKTNYDNLSYTWGEFIQDYNIIEK
jgi:hypothetical protein